MDEHGHNERSRDMSDRLAHETRVLTALGGEDEHRALKVELLNCQLALENANYRTWQLLGQPAEFDAM